MKINEFFHNICTKIQNVINEFDWLIQWDDVAQIYIIDDF